jgi:hypothetical protein
MIFLVVPYVRKFQSYTLEERYVVYALALSPFFVGMGLWGVHEFLSRRLSRFSSKGKLISKVLYVSVVFLLISASLVQVFPCQPLVPQVEGLYVVDYRGANSIYQREMIAFFGEHFPSDVKVSSDGMTSWQLLGLTNASFNFDYLYQQNPLVENESLATVVLLHYGGRSGRLNEPIEYRTLEHVTEVRSGFGNSVYDNGESFVIVRATHP